MTKVAQSEIHIAEQQYDLNGDSMSFTAFRGDAPRGTDRPDLLSVVSVSTYGPISPASVQDSQVQAENDEKRLCAQSELLRLRSLLQITAP